MTKSNSEFGRRSFLKRFAGAAVFSAPVVAALASSVTAQSGVSHMQTEDSSIPKDSHMTDEHMTDEHVKVDVKAPSNPTPTPTP
jgi:hypothetical protein